MNTSNIKLNFLQAQLVAKALKKEYPCLTVAFCKGMTPSGLAYEALRESGVLDENQLPALVARIADTARLNE